MAAVVCSLCAVTAMLCTWLLIQAHRRRQSGLLLWSGLAFAGLTLNNVLLVLDKLVFLQVDLSVNAVALLAMIVLLYGLVWKSQ